LILSGTNNLVTCLLCFYSKLNVIYINTGTSSLTYACTNIDERLTLSLFNYVTEQISSHIIVLLR